MEHSENTGNVHQSYVIECKKEVRVDVEIPMGLGCRNAIHRNFRGIIPLTQRASLEETILWIEFLLNSFENPSIQRGP
jgi:hypothetical protein